MEQRRSRQGPETWARVREAYLAGAPALEVAQRFGVTVSALRKRSQEQGWTRKHQERFDEAPEVRWSPKLRPGVRVSKRALTVEQFKALWPEVWGEMEDIAAECALEALGAHPEDAGFLSDWAYRWRAETFGPDCAAEDERLRPEREAQAEAVRRQRIGG